MIGCGVADSSVSDRRVRMVGVSTVGVMMGGCEVGGCEVGGCEDGPAPPNSLTTCIPPPWGGFNSCHRNGFDFCHGVGPIELGGLALDKG